MTSSFECSVLLSLLTHIAAGSLLAASMPLGSPSQPSIKDFEGHKPLLPRSLLVPLHHCFHHNPPLYYAESELIYQQMTNMGVRSRQLSRYLRKLGDEPARTPGKKGALLRCTGLAPEQRYERRRRIGFRRFWAWASAPGSLPSCHPLQISSGIFQLTLLTAPPLAVLPLLHAQYLKHHLDICDDPITLLCEPDPPGAAPLLRKLPHMRLSPEVMSQLVGTLNLLPIYIAGCLDKRPMSQHKASRYRSLLPTTLQPIFRRCRL